jgi:hypothetical protein
LKVKKFNPFLNTFEKNFNEWAEDKVIIETKWADGFKSNSVLVFYEEYEEEKIIEFEVSK